MSTCVDNDRPKICSTGFTLCTMRQGDGKVLGVMIEGLLKGLVSNCPLPRVSDMQGDKRRLVEAGGIHFVEYGSDRLRELVEESRV